MTRIALATATVALASIAWAHPTRLVRCNSGKTGRIDLFVESSDGGFVLTSKDSAKNDAERVFSGKVLHAAHEHLDKRHHIYVFDLQDGQLEQAAGLDEKRCQASGARASCRIDALSVKLAYHGPREPEDDGVIALQDHQAIQMDNGGPQNCTVYASKALTKLLKAGQPR